MTILEGIVIGLLALLVLAADYIRNLADIDHGVGK